jgi:hypothetical protein
MTLRLPAEWEAQDGVLLAWPHETSDWHPVLDASSFFRNILIKVKEGTILDIVDVLPEMILPLGKINIILSIHGQWLTISSH